MSDIAHAGARAGLYRAHVDSHLHVSSRACSRKGELSINYELWEIRDLIASIDLSAAEFDDSVVT